MLTYFIKTTQQLMIMAVLCGLTTGLLSRCFSEKAAKFMRGVLLAAMGVSLVFTLFKTRLGKIDTALVNCYLFFIYTGALVLFFIFSGLSLRWKKVRIPAVAVLAVAVFVQIFYFLPPAFEYPHTIMLTEDSLLSTNFLVKMIGVLFGAILVLVTGLAANRASRIVKPGLSVLAFAAVSILTAYKFVMTAMGVLMGRRLISVNHTLFVMARNASNRSDWYVYASIAVVLVLHIVLVIASFTQNEPYTNPAQHRKILAKWKRIRKWALTSGICVITAILLLTVGVYYDSMEVELSPIEECENDGVNMVVPFEKVSDGKLHRFGYKADNGTVIRFIVIQKPNSSSYGIGLDACDICGETGYYEKNGQVVCNLCDVVMNINTIGFKGGCNPIVIDYSMQNGAIFVPIEGLLEHQKVFER